MKKKKTGIIIAVVVVALIFFYIIGVTVGDTKPASDPDMDISSSEIVSSQESINSSSMPASSENSNYKDKATWAALGNYMFAVEISDFDGDIFKAGTYRFYPSAVDLNDPSKTPIVWDIYVSENLYNNSEELKDSELVATVGGMGKDETTLELLPGQYVYINYNQTLGEPTGMLEIERNNT